MLKKKKDHRGEKLSSGLIDHTSWWVKGWSLDDGIPGWNSFSVPCSHGGSVFSNSASGLCGMVFERFY